MKKEDQQSLIAIPFSILVGIGMAWAGSQGGYSIAGIPIFALGVAAAFLINWLAFIPAFLKRTQAFYDLIGSVTNITVILLCVLLTPVVDSRSWLLAGLIIVWAGRLGYFLVTRVRLDGEDRRFQEIKLSFLRFLLAWTMQGLWVTFILAAALAAVTSTVKIPLDGFAMTGFLVWLAGFSIEMLADRQKREFRSNPENKEPVHTARAVGLVPASQLLRRDRSMDWRGDHRLPHPARLAVFDALLPRVRLHPAHQNQRHPHAGNPRR